MAMSIWGLLYFLSTVVIVVRIAVLLAKVYVIMENPDSSPHESMVVDNADCKISGSFCERTIEEDELEQNSGIVHRHYSMNKRAWRGQYCCVLLCCSS